MYAKSDLAKFLCIQNIYLCQWRQGQVSKRNSSVYSCCSASKKDPCREKALLNVTKIVFSPFRDFHITFTLFKKREFYDILGIQKGATLTEIKTAYNQLAKKYHPVSNANNPHALMKFQEISQAYHVLSDEEKRLEYDMRGTESKNKKSALDTAYDQNKLVRHSWQFRSTLAGQELMNKMFVDGNGVFTDTFGVEFPDSSFECGSVEDIVLELTFEQAATGCTKDMYVSAIQTCPACNGTRCHGGKLPPLCMCCVGTGKERIMARGRYFDVSCRHCDGLGEVVERPCKKCLGKGSVFRRKKLSICVPEGVKNGYTMRLPVEKKTVFVTFKVNYSDYFRQVGYDVYTDNTISLSQALLGGVTKIRGIREDLEVDIPAGTTSDTIIKVSGKGLKNPYDDHHGDHYIKLKIHIPKNLSAKQKALIRVFAELENDTPGLVNGIVGTRTPAAEETGALSDIQDMYQERVGCHSFNNIPQIFKEPLSLWSKREPMEESSNNFEDEDCVAFLDDSYPSNQPHHCASENCNSENNQDNKPPKCVENHRDKSLSFIDEDCAIVVDDVQNENDIDDDDGAE